MIEYIVNFGDTFYSITRKFNIETKELLAANPGIINPDVIVPGQVILVPYIVPSKQTISVNGYTFLNVDHQTLVSRFPYLTYLSILSYQFNPDGTLIGIDDMPYIQLARKAGVAPIMVISNTNANGSYSADLAHAMLSNYQSQLALITNMVSVLNSKNYYGLNFNFEYLYPDDIYKYSIFLRLAAETLRPLGYLVQLSMRMSVLTEQSEELQEIDRADLFRGIDRFIIMSNELSYTLGQTMVMPPLDQVQRALDFAVSSVPSSKILLGVPNSSYDWMLPKNLGVPGQILSKDLAIALYKSTGGIMQFDATNKGSYFSYIDHLGDGHIVWIEDGSGFEYYLKLVSTYSLDGVSLWTVDVFTSAEYQLLQATYEIRRVISPESNHEQTV